MSKENVILPEIPNKRYFTIGEVSDLCFVKPHVLRYWEQEFSHISPSKRRGRRYYRTEDVLIVRLIRQLLYIDGFTISGARERLKQSKKQELLAMKRVHQPQQPIDEVVFATTTGNNITQDQFGAEEPLSTSNAISLLIRDLEKLLEIIRN
jgi:DNA-binding transcriptional MerR regulator